MGHTTCGQHRTRCCWRCDRCGVCDPKRGKLIRGDYCADCIAKFKKEGMVWNRECRDYVEPAPTTQGSFLV